MGEEYKIIKKTFHHDVVEGSHYEIGKQQGEMIRKKRPEAVKWFISENNIPKN